MLTAAFPPRAAAFGLWLLAAASAAYWGLRLTSAPAAAPVAVAAPVAAPADPVAVGRLLGAGAMAAAPSGVAAPPASSRFALVGVVAGASQRGAALIAVDGKPAKPFRVGARVDEGLVLQSVAPRRATLGPADGPAAFTLELPPRK